MALRARFSDLFNKMVRQMTILMGFGPPLPTAEVTWVILVCVSVASKCFPG